MAMNTVRARDLVRYTTFVGGMVEPMYWLVVSIGENGDGGVRIRRGQSRLASIGTGS